MSKIDMHVHTRYSERPSEWFLQRIGARESYSAPQDAFSTALGRGMDMVTITDHNRIDGALALKEQYPDQVLVGVETTTYFPEDRCKIHLLLYGITPSQFADIQWARADIYDLAGYVRREGIAYSVAHATYAINDKLTSAHLEKLILLFDVFEGINGSRSQYFNEHWMEILRRLTPEHIEALSVKHKLQPMGADPWVKGFTGGSDDHSGLFIGRTWSEVEAAYPEEIAAELRAKRVTAHGRHNDYKNLAFAIYKIALDYTREKKGQSTGSLLYSISEQLFADRGTAHDPKRTVMGMRSLKRQSGDLIAELIAETITQVRSVPETSVEERLDLLYDKVAQIADAFFSKILESVIDDLGQGNLSDFLLNISTTLPGMFLSLPFLSALKHMYANREIIETVAAGLGLDTAGERRKVLWFTDTIQDLNGVSETLKDIAWLSQKNGREVRLVIAQHEQIDSRTLPEDTIVLPTFFDFRLPMYQDIVVRFPSLLKAIELVYKEAPTEIYISTPGPIGLLGLLMARLLKIKSTGVYHTDFTMQLERIARESTLPEFVERGMHWFYSAVDVVRAPTREYIQMLIERGIDPAKIGLMPKSIDPQVFRPMPLAGRRTRKNLGMKDGLTLMYAGRVSPDKNLEILRRAYTELITVRPDLNLLIVGDGPYLKELKTAMNGLPRVRFTGRVNREELPAIYSASDIFVFPSTTDTFGMAVLEAQACGLPAIVSEIGGPHEIVLSGATGLVAASHDPAAWQEAIEHLIKLFENDPAAFAAMQKAARSHALDAYGRATYLERILRVDDQIREGRCSSMTKLAVGQ